VLTLVTSIGIITSMIVYPITNIVKSTLLLRLQSCYPALAARSHVGLAAYDSRKQSRICIPPLVSTTPCLLLAMLLHLKVRSHGRTTHHGIRSHLPCRRHSKTQQRRLRRRRSGQKLVSTAHSSRVSRSKQRCQMWYTLSLQILALV
jgi:hypothetical protein